MSEWGPVRYVNIVGNRIGYNPDGRNGIQLNGRFRFGEIADNIIFHFQNDGIEFKGVQKFGVHGNLIYGGNRGKGVVMPDYKWAGWEPEMFKKYHHPCQDNWIAFNTVVVGPHGFSTSKSHPDHPDDHHPVFELSNTVHADPDWAPYPNKNIIFDRNAIWTPNQEVVKLKRKHEADATSFTNNIVCCAHKNQWPTMPAFPFKHVKGNVLYDGDPKLFFDDGLPTYIKAVDLDLNPDYDFSKHKSTFGPFSMAAHTRDMGMKFPDPTTAGTFKHPFKD